jgi:DNA-binding transcriptional ArsR family regulator
MEFFGRGRGRYTARQEQALDNPIRVRITELFTRDEARLVAAKALVHDLATEDGCFTKLSAAQVAYHLACLRDAHLIPAEKPDPG